MLGRRYHALLWFVLCISVAGILAIAFLTFVEAMLIQPSDYADLAMIADETTAIARTTERRDNGDTKTISAILERRQLLRNRCIGYTENSISLSDTRTRMLYSRQLNATMCYVPKAGCTFWKRVFLSAEHSRMGNAFDVSHHDIHFTAMTNMLDMNKFDESFRVLTSSKRLIFTREPFSRLFSVYVDKFYLSNFWNYGVNVIGFFRSYPDAKSLKCGNDVTFSEFLKYALYGRHLPPYGGAQEHWIPVTELCRPCTFDYDVIGHQETFDDDRDYITNALGIEKRFKRIRLADTFHSAIYQLVQTHWSMIQFGKHPCITSEDYLRRIWKALQFQGYLPYNASFPARFLGGGLLANLDMNTTTKVIYDATGADRVTKSLWRERREGCMASMYAGVELELREKIGKLYQYDHVLFGYDPRPRYVFGGPRDVS